MMSFRSDHFSVKDMAQSQMLLDECLFFCESIVSQRNPLEPLESLAEMLSNRESRRHLFLSSSSQGPSQALQGVIKVFAWVNQFVENNEGDDSGGSSTKLPASQSSCDTLSSIHNHDLPDRQPILNAAKLVAHYVSLDCTLCPEAAHATKNNQGSAAAARRIRHAILSNRECMQGLFQLVLDDPLTERLRDDGKAAREDSSQGVKDKDVSPKNNTNDSPGSVSLQ
jgi:hypothetical protein